MRFPRRALARGRANAEELMSDHILIERITGYGPIDPVTTTRPPIYTTIHDGIGKIQAYEGQYEQSKQAGGGDYVESRSWLHTPVDAGPFQQGDRVTIIAAPHDPSRIGEQFLLEAATGKSIATAQRLPITIVEAIV